MAYWNQEAPFGVNKAVIAFADGIETPNSVSISREFFTADAMGRKALPEGLFVAQVGNVFRFLPRARTSARSASGVATLTVSPSQVFIPGDVLWGVEPSARITFGGTWVANETVTITIGGLGVTVAAPTTSIGDLITAVVNAINLRNIRVRAVADATSSKVYVYAKDGVSLIPISVSEASAAGTIAVDGSATALAYPTSALGTVLSVNPATNVVTLTGNLSVDVPAGAGVGVQVSDILGVYPHALDMTYAPTLEIAPVSGAHGVYESALPYFDGDIERRLPKLRVRVKF